MKKIIKTADLILSVVCCIIFVLIALGNAYVPKSTVFFGDVSEATVFHIYKIKEVNSCAVPVSVTDTQDSEANVSLFGIFPMEKIGLTHKAREFVKVGGDVIGIRMYTDGLMVVGVEDVDTSDGKVCPGEQSGIHKGDIITKINGEDIISSSEFGKKIISSNGDDISVTIKRDGNEINVKLTPVYSEKEQKYRCGLWLRDSTAGIGTLTFIDPETMTFGSLGHAICDSDTNNIIPVGDGDILSATVTGCDPGEKGSTGQIQGTFTGNILGKIDANGEFGVYGTITEDVFADSEIYPVASRTEIEPGEAKIISTVCADGKAEYDIEIEKITYSSDLTSRSMIIRVTDDELLAVTGGIVRGMSGSPIIQNGMLVGAVTHVFLNDPERGYAIFADTMTQTAKN